MPAFLRPSKLTLNNYLYIIATKTKEYEKLFLITTMLFVAVISQAQNNYSGAYGYSFKPNGNTGNDKDATGPAGNLVLLKMDGDKYRFWLDVTIGWPNYNVGETDGTITIVNDTASFDNTFEEATKPCILKFKIAGNTIHINSLSTSFNCGFGNGVNADGDYTKLKNQPVLNNAWLKRVSPISCYCCNIKQGRGFPG